MTASFRSAEPALFFTFIVTVYLPSLTSVPVIIPVFLSRAKPLGSFSAEYSRGRIPVAAIVNWTGALGLTPNTLAPLILGAADGLGVRTTNSLFRASIYLS